MMFDLQIKECREYDVAVLGGGIAGTAAAISPSFSIRTTRAASFASFIPFWMRTA